MTMKKRRQKIYTRLLAGAILIGWSASSLAHYIDISASATCDIGKGFVIHYQSSSSDENKDITILFDNKEVGSGSYTSPDYAFSGSAPAPAGSLPDDEVKVTVRADGDWISGETGEIANDPDVENTVSVRLPEDNCNGLGDRVWEDLNNDGVQNCEDTNGNGILGDVVEGQETDPEASDQGAECGGLANGGAGIAGVEVSLYQTGLNGACSIDTGMRQYTGENGFYLFEDLIPGNYCVRFNIGTLSENFCDTDVFTLGAPKFTDQDVGVDEARDSDADPANGFTELVALAPGVYNRTLDAGIVCPAKIGNFVWVDDNDGLQNGEPGVEGVRVNLYECGPDGVAGTEDDGFTGETRVTDINGEYMFGGELVYDLPPGDYYVQFDPATLPTGYVFTTPKEGGNDSIDSDCLPSDGGTSCVTLGSREINLDRDCGIVPPCGLAIDKQCRVETPPAVSEDAKCDGKLKQFTVIWNGDEAITISGLPNDDDDGIVTPDQEVTFYGPFDSNDVFVDITGHATGVTGQSKFHMSCSDPDMDGDSSSNEAQPQVSVIGRDCGKNQGDAKDNGDPDFINDWLLEGFVDNSDQVLDCTLPELGDGFAQDCNFIKGPGPSCESLNAKPTRLTFKYTGGGCANSDNSQDAGKAVCTPQPAGSMVSGPITVLYAGSDDNLSGNPYMVDQMNVDEGGLFTISADSFSSNSYLQIGDGIATELNLFHTSCSQPLAVGDVFGSLTLVGFNGHTGGVDVSYQYTITNTGSPLTGVVVEDTVLGYIGEVNLAYDETRILNAGPVNITETTTNTVTASVPGSLCSASDSVTVTAQEPACEVSVVFDNLDDDKVKYKLTNNSGIVATLDTFALNFPAAYGVIKEIKLDGGIYKAGDSALVAGPGIVISAVDWTEPDVSKRELDPGETRTLEIVFTAKHKGGDWAGLVDAGGLVIFEEHCEVILRAPNACEIERPTELVFEYTGDACSATTNTQEGAFKCEPAAGDAIGDLSEVIMTKDADKFAIGYTGSGFSIYRSDDPGKEFPSEIKYDVIGTSGTQSHVLHTSCSKPLNLDDRFGALILREFHPKTH